MQSRYISLATLTALALTTAAFAQDHPRETVTANVGGKKVTVEYGRPALKGRKIDDLLKQLPEDRMWRAGVDQVTTLITEGDILIGDKKVPAGKYTVYVNAPATGQWSLAINSDQGVPLKTIFAAAPPNLANEPWPHIEDYQKAIAAKEVARAAMTSGTPATPAEMFTITLAPKGDAAAMTLAWGDRTWTLDVKPAKPATKK